MSRHSADCMNPVSLAFYELLLTEGLVWKLERPLPAKLFREFSVLRGI